MPPIAIWIIADFHFPGNEIWQLSVFLFFFGFAGDILNISMNTQGLSVQHALNKPILSGLHAQWSIGALAGAVIGGWSMKNNYSTGQHFFMVSAGATAIALWMFFYMVKDYQHEGAGQKLFTWPGRALLLLGMICFCTAMAEGAMADWSSLYYRQVLKDQTKVSTTGYTAFTFAMAIGRLMGDRLIQVFRFRNMLILNGVLISMGLTLALVWQVPVAVISGYALVGLGCFFGYTYCLYDCREEPDNGPCCGPGHRKYHWIYRFPDWPACNWAHCP